MSKQWKPSKKTVELEAAPRPSRIRREPPPAEPARKAVNPYPTEREVWAAVIGVIFFAIALTIITLGFSDITSR